jgi:hypothetical protein
MDTKLLRPLTILAVLLSVSLAVVSAFGAFDPATYLRDSASMGAQGIGQDLVDLFLVAPLLLVSLYFTRKGNRTWTFIFGGTVFYIMYSFVIYAFGVNFNRLFLLYCTTLGLSLYAFILFVHMLSRMNVKEWYIEKVPVRLAGIFLLIVAAIFYALWLKDVVPAIISGSTPASVSQYNLLVNPVHVADLAFALPGMVLTAWLVMKKRNFGFILAPVALVFAILLAIALVAMVVMLKVKGVNDDISVAVIFAGIAVLSMIILVLFLRKLKPQEKAGR